MFSHVFFNKTGFYTVNSSPYAKEIYEHLGFKTTSSEQSISGLRFYPMINNNVLEYQNEINMAKKLLK